MNWIKVSERLPEVDDSYLVKCDGWNYSGFAVCEFATDSKGYFWSYEPSGDISEYVTHWCEIELPKED